jgi:pimeloyl-ACP methyl ester carboxylesterase
MTKIEANGIQINYEIQGEGEPLILLMGLGASGRKWERHLAVYKKHFKCILIDNRGAGYSDKPKMDAYTTEMMAEDTIGVMDALNIQKAHFHGISMGGAISQIIAAKYPERVISLVLTSTFAKPDVFFTRALEILRDSVGVLDGKTFSHLCQYMIYSAQYHEKCLDAMLNDELADANDPCPMPAYAYRAQCNACITHDSLLLLKDIKAPTLVAAGDSDLFVSLAETQQLVQSIPGAKLYLCNDGGHVHHWEHLQKFNEVTLSFLLNHREGGMN